MSTDSLGLASYEEDSSDEEAQMHGRLTRGRSRDEQGNPAISHSEDPFVPAEREKHLQGDEQEQLSEPSMVTCFHIPTCFFFFLDKKHCTREL